jgi:hypothetical protein
MALVPRVAQESGQENLAKTSLPDLPLKQITTLQMCAGLVFEGSGRLRFAGWWGRLQGRNGTRRNREQGFDLLDEIEIRSTFLKQEGMPFRRRQFQCLLE